MQELLALLAAGHLHQHAPHWLEPASAGQSLLGLGPVDSVVGIELNPFKGSTLIQTIIHLPAPPVKSGQDKFFAKIIQDNDLAASQIHGHAKIWAELRRGGARKSLVRVTPAELD